MAKEITNNPRVEKSDEKLQSSTDPANKNLVSSDAGKCVSKIRRSEKQNAKKKHCNNLRKLQKDY